MGNAWWTINNLNCGIDVNIKSTCYINFTQIAEIQPVKGLSVNITEFAFGANLFIRQNRRICDRQKIFFTVQNVGRVNMPPTGHHPETEHPSCAN